MSTAGAGLFITTDAVGGVWSYSVALARGMASTGARCVLAVLGPALTPDQRSAVAGIAGLSLIETGCPLDWTMTSRRELDAALPDLVAQARALGCNAAHLHAPALAARPWPMPVVAVAHSCMATWWDAVRGGTPPAGIAWHKAATAEGLSAAKVVAPSHAFAAALQHVYLPARPIHVIRNGLPEAKRSGTPREKIVLAAGRLWDAAKNIGVLDAAAALTGVPVCAAGAVSGPDGAVIQFKHLRMLGNLTQDALRTRMEHSAIFAAPSVYEPFGLAVLEAAQLGCALVLSDIPVFRELWSGAAMFVHAGRPADWAAAMSGLANDAEEIARLGQAAATRSRRYTQHAMVSATLALHGPPGERASRAA